MKQHYTKAEKEAYHQGQARIKAAQERFDSFMTEHGWTKYHLFMRGTKWVKGDDVLIHDAKGWHLNGVIVPEQDVKELFVN
jgi:hypothetical protein